MLGLKKLFKKQSFLFSVAILAILFVFQNTQVLFAAAPTVTTGSASNITKTTAELNGSITDIGGEAITDAGFEYGLTASYGSSVSATLSYGDDSQIGTASDFINPYDVALDSSGNIYIADSGNHRIQKFNSSGVFQMMFGWGVDTGASALEVCTSSCQAGSFGTGDGELSGPSGIVVDSLGNIYVADSGNNRIQKFNSAGAYQLKFGTAGSGNGQFSNPFRLDLDSLGNIYVADLANARIQKFNSSGIYQSQFGVPGIGDGEFSSPIDIALDSANNIFVLDSDLNRVQKFDSAGSYQSQFGTGGGGNGEFNLPYGIAIDSADNIFVADNGNARIQKFNSSGVYQSQFGSGISSSPVGIDEYSGSIYVSETNSNDVIFKFSQTSFVEIVSLSCGTTYHFRAYATNTDGTSYGNDNTFTTSDCEPPEVDTKAATNIASTSATINGFDLILNNLSIADVDRGFEYGFTTSYGQTVSESGQLISTFGSANTYGGDVDSSDGFYIPSLSSDFVEKFNSAGVLQFQFGTLGTGNGEFDNPSDVAIDSSGNVYVLDVGNNRVQKFNSSGVYQSQFGTSGTGNGEFNSPEEMAIDLSDNIYVVDYFNSRVQKFNSSGVYQSQFGTAGTGNGEFNNPVGIAIDSSGNIYVADYGAGLTGRIQKFNSSGVYISDFYTGFVNYVGDEGILSLTFDLDGSMYVAGGNSDDFIKLDSSGNFVTSINFNDLGYSSSILIDSQNDIYAGNRKVNRNFYADISSLKCGTTYHFRAFATNAEGTDYGDDMTFDTAACSGGGGGSTPTYGCTNPIAINYNPSATVDDGSCVTVDPPSTYGCTDPDATNYSSTALTDDGSCIYNPGAIPGCTDSVAGNYDSNATVDDGSCLYGVFGCMDPLATNYNPLAVYTNNSCEYEGGGPGPTSEVDVYGCMSPEASNFNSAATIDDGSCNFIPPPSVFGCVDMNATNYDSDATTDDGSCSYINIPIIGDIVGEVMGGVRKIPEEVLTTTSVVGLITPPLLLNFLQPGLIAGVIIRLWNLIPVLMGYKRKKRPWGTVYDSITKQPLDPVYVKLIDTMGQEKSTSITDLDGRYGFLTEAGLYKLLPSKDNYEFPSKKLAGKDKDELYDNLYFGGEIVVKEKEGIVYKNIPMDALNFNWNEFAKAENKKLMKFYSKRDLFLARIANILFIAGFVSSLILFSIDVTVINSIVLSLYAVILILRIFGVKPKQAGRAYDADGTPLSFGIIRLFSAALGKEVAHTVVGKTGRYYMLVPNGEYYIKVSKKTGEDAYEEMLTTPPFRVSGGYVNRKIAL